MSSPSQIAANRENATHSTGPRTAAGKNHSNMNALRHGLTGRIVVLPTEDMAEFKRFSRLMLDNLAPADTIEQQLAQTIADSHWRINRILSIEDGMLALDQFEQITGFETEDPALNSVLTQARAFRDHSKTFVNLSIYEQRIHRTMEKAHKQLQELQTARRAIQAAAMTEQIPGLKSLQTNDLPPRPMTGESYPRNGVDQSRPMVEPTPLANGSASGQSCPHNGIDQPTPLANGFVYAGDVIALEADLEHRRKRAIRAGLYVPTIDEINDCIDRYGLPALDPMKEAA